MIISIVLGALLLVLGGVASFLMLQTPEYDKESAKILLVVALVSYLVGAGAVALGGNL